MAEYSPQTNLRASGVCKEPYAADYIAAQAAGIYGSGMGKNLPPLKGATLVDRIFEAVENAGFRLNPAAREMKMPSSTLYSWKGGAKAPGLASVRKVALLTGYSVADLSGDEEKPAEDDPAPLREFLATPMGKRAEEDSEAMEYLRSPHFGRMGMSAESYQNLFNAYEHSQAGVSARQAAAQQHTDELRARGLAKGRVAPKNRGQG